MVAKTIPGAEELYRLYWVEGLSTRAIAKNFDTHQRAIIRLMQEYGIPRRDRIRAVVKGCIKHVKIPFNGFLQDKAYMLGFTFADLGRRRHGYQIRVSSRTTHPAFSELFKDIFECYANVYGRPYFRKNIKKYNWELEAFLHPSFEFLLSPKGVPEWVLREDGLFLNFLAGYTDGEGTLSISKTTKRNVSFLFCISSGDTEILVPICKKLKTMSYHPTLRILRKAGDTNTFDGLISRYSKNHWMLRLKRKKEVLKLIQILPIRHGEKIRKRQLMLELKDKFSIKNVEKPVMKLRNEIKSEVSQYLKSAEIACKEKRSTSDFSL